jgi:hypothetical protein
MRKIAGLVLVSATLSGCQNLLMQPNYDSPRNQNPYFQPASSVPSHNYNQAPVQQQQPIAQQAPLYVSGGVSDEVVGKVGNLMERVRRVERAMIRLDRRMQLIERNELSRMTNGVMQGESTQAPNQGAFQPMSYSNEQRMPAQQPGRLPAVKQPYTKPLPTPARSGYQPVAYPDNRITSSLGVARQAVSKATMPNGRTSSFSGMASLADTQSNQKDSSKGSVSIWTIEYENGKVWPAREQLISSKSVVRALAGEKPAAIYARGARPSSKEFRERVRAVSKYLSKVTKVDNVPIASMPAKHMHGDTIEIIVTK